jgi:outer membrane protein
MKKLVLSLALIAFSVGYIFGQAGAGSKMLGGSVNLISYKEQQGAGSDDYKISGFQLTPSFGYFISDNFVIGGNLSYSSFTENDQGFKWKSTELAIGPFVRMYKYTSNEKFAFFAEGSLLFGSGKEDPDGPGEFKSRSITLAISPGFAYFISDKWVIDFQLQGISYRSYDPNTDVDDDKETTLIFGVDSFNPSLGFRFIF